MRNKYGAILTCVTGSGPGSGPGPVRGNCSSFSCSGLLLRAPAFAAFAALLCGGMDGFVVCGQ